MVEEPLGSDSIVDALRDIIAESGRRILDEPERLREALTVALGPRDVVARAWIVAVVEAAAVGVPRSMIEGSSRREELLERLATVLPPALPAVTVLVVLARALSLPVDDLIDPGSVPSSPLADGPMTIPVDDSARAEPSPGPQAGPSALPARSVISADDSRVVSLRRVALLAAGVRSIIVIAGLALVLFGGEADAPFEATFLLRTLVQVIVIVAGLSAVLMRRWWGPAMLAIEGLYASIGLLFTNATGLPPELATFFGNIAVAQAVSAGILLGFHIVARRAESATAQHFPSEGPESEPGATVVAAPPMRTWGDRRTLVLAGGGLAVLAAVAAGFLLRPDPSNPPSAGSFAFDALSEDGELTACVLDDAFDPDGEPLTVASASLQSGGDVEVEVVKDSQDCGGVDALRIRWPAGWSGTLTVSYIIEDPVLLSATGTGTVTVAAPTGSTAASPSAPKVVCPLPLIAEYDDWPTLGEPIIIGIPADCIEDPDHDVSEIVLTLAPIGSTGAAGQLGSLGDVSPDFCPDVFRDRVCFPFYFTPPNPASEDEPVFVDFEATFTDPDGNTTGPVPVRW